MIYGQADLLILGAIKGAKTVGFYAVADRSAELVNFAITAVNASLAPTMAAIFATGDRERLRIAFSKVVRITFLISFPVGMVLIVFGRQWLGIVYGPAFGAAYTALAILTTGQILCAAAGPVGLLLIMTGHEREALRAISVSAVVNVTLCFALIPKWEMTGAAIAAATSSVVWSILLLLSVHKRLGMAPSLFGKNPFRN
jgi:O-antigen/teichoic acid export membrane protein